MVFPTFADLHTHVDKSHTADRSRNPTGALGGADASTAADGLFWVPEELERRMHFALECAYAHGTSAVRTHLINMTPRQVELTWPAFDRVRRAWKGRVELQGVSLVTLSFFRDEEAARRLADVVAAHGGLMGAAVCSTDRGGLEDEDWTTCARDRDLLLDRLFRLAAERSLDVDLHVDENGNPESRGALDVARAIRRARNGWPKRVEGSGDKSKGGAGGADGGSGVDGLERDREAAGAGGRSPPAPTGGLAPSKAETKGSVENENENEHGEEVANGSCAPAGAACGAGADGSGAAPVAASAAKGGLPNGNGNVNGVAHVVADGTAAGTAPGASPTAPATAPAAAVVAAAAASSSPSSRVAPVASANDSPRPLRFRGRVVLGHLCSLAMQSPAQVEETARALAAVGATVVSLPLVNAWTQDRWPREAVESERTHVAHEEGGAGGEEDGADGVGAGPASAPPSSCAPPAPALPSSSVGEDARSAPAPPSSRSARLHAFGASTRTPRRRGLTDLHALARAGVPVAVASDNVRDQFHAYGDMDMLEVFAWAVRAGHLDRPFGAWPRAVGAVPANAMGLPRLCRLGEGLPADFVIFRARRFTELLSRPQEDRVVVRAGAPLYLRPPHLDDLDDLGDGFRPEEW